MRFVEILIEGYSDKLESDLQDLLAAAKARGVSEVSTTMLVSQLVDLGHNVNNVSIMSALNGNPFVQTASPEQVNLKPSDRGAVSGDAEARQDNEERVSQMAQNAAGKMDDDLV
jgi:hypothetical protein